VFYKLFLKFKKKGGGVGKKLRKLGLEKKKKKIWRKKENWFIKNLLVQKNIEIKNSRDKKKNYLN